MKIVIALAAAAIAAGLSAASAQDSDERLTAEQFVVAAGISNMFEIEASRIAEQRAKNADVKAFATQMIADHTKAGEEMKAAAQKAGVEVPTELDEDSNQKLTTLRDEADDDFDATYVDQQVEAHERAVALFTNFAQNGEQADLKAFAQATLPTLQRHLEEIRGLDSATSNM